MKRHRNQIELKSPPQFQAMRRAGLVVAAALAAMSDACRPGVTTLELDSIARDVLAGAGATSNFLNYDIGTGPYPGVICSSVNDNVVHGIPSADAVLSDGDLISIDFGAIVDGWHGDAAVTVGVGHVDPTAAALSASCRESLWAGLAAVRPGGRLGDVSAAVQASVEGSGQWGIVEGYGGHGIGSAMHMDPHVLNYGHPGTGPKLTVGMALAIEPMITTGSPDTRQHADGWTVSTVDGSLAAHWEHSVAIFADGPFVLTATDGGRAELADRGITVSSRLS